MHYHHRGYYFVVFLVVCCCCCCSTCYTLTQNLHRISWQNQIMRLYYCNVLFWKDKLAFFVRYNEKKIRIESPESNQIELHRWKTQK